MEAIILAGGLGTRLAARLNGVPKPMAPVAGRPFLEILLSQMKRAGATHVLLSVGHLHKVIEDRFGAAFDGMRLSFVIEEVPLGTGGAIRAALCHATEENVLVLNGDTFLDADYAALMRFHEAEGADLTMAISRQPDIARYGGVVVDGGRVVGFQEKGQSGPGWINAGAYVLKTAMQWPARLHDCFSIETDFLAVEIDRLFAAAYEVEGLFLDIGVPEDLDRAQRDLAGFVC
jgi:D-glycero-alpha-D-manno-heptose 1-phosphate guanylyltransferase